MIKDTDRWRWEGPGIQVQNVSQSGRRDPVCQIVLIVTNWEDGDLTMGFSNVEHLW